MALNDRTVFFLSHIFGDVDLRNTIIEMVEAHEAGPSPASVTILQEGTEISSTITNLNFQADNGISLDIQEDPDDNTKANILIGCTVQPGIPSGSSTISGDADVTVGDGNDSTMQFSSKRFSVTNRFRIVPIDKATRDAMTQVQPGDMVYLQDGFNSLYGLQLYDGLQWVVITST